MVEIENKRYEELPNVSIIILTYNGSKYIKNLLDSLHDQSYPLEKMEIMVVDNASIDNTVQIIRESYPSVIVLSLPRNIGYAAGNNHALQYARYDYMVFLNQDTICHRDWLKGLVACMVEHKEVGACTSNMVMSEVEASPELDRHSHLNALYYYDLSIFGYAKYRTNTQSRIVFTKIISGCSFIIRRETIAELGYLFDEDLWMYVEDTDLSLRIHNLGYKTCATQDSIVYHLHVNNMTLNFKRIQLASKAIMNRVYAFFKNMSGLEFILFLPFLFIGSIFKIFEFSIKTHLKLTYFIPFAIFSVLCMIIAVFGLPHYITKRTFILKQRHINGLPILKLVLRY